MKLPGHKSREAEALKSTQGTQGAYQEAGRARAGLAAAAGNAYEVAEDIRNQHQVSNAQVSATNRLSEFRGKYGERESFTGEELQALGWEVEGGLYETDTNDNGETEPVLRAHIPAYEAYPQALEKKWKAEANTASKTISRPGARKAFDQAQERQRARAMESERQRAVKLNRDFMEKEESSLINDSVVTGNYPGARGIIMASKFLDKNEKKEAIKQTYIHQEDRTYLAVASSGDEDLIQQTIAYLEGKDSDNPYIVEGQPDKSGHLPPAERAKYVKLLKGAQRDIDQEGDKFYRENILGGAWDAVSRIPPGPQRKEWLFNARTPQGLSLVQALKGKDLIAMQNFVEHGPPLETSIDTWQQMEEMKRLDPQAFADQDFNQLRGVASDTDIRKWMQEAQAWKTGKDRTGGETWNNQKNYMVKSSGIATGAGASTMDVQREMAVKRLADRELQLFEEKNGPASTADRQAIVDSIVINEKVETYGGWFGSSKAKDVNFKDVPVADLDLSSRWVRALGINVTDTNMYIMSVVFKEMRKKDLDPLQADAETMREYYDKAREARRVN